MDLPEEQPMESSQPASPHNSGGRRRRGRRGGRGRGARRSVQTAQAAQPASAPVEGPSVPEMETPTTGGGEKDSSAISRAIDEVRQIVISLEQVLEQMEEVRELVELVDRQKSADEREIESLRRALRRIQQPRGHRDAPPERDND
jgi:hypothetical protein